MVGLALLAACLPTASPVPAVTPATITASAAPTDTAAPATVTPMILCTAPACQAGEALYCPGDCPGGCGTVCATFTPEAAVTTPAAAGVPCVPVVRPPPPEAPTASTNGTPEPNRRVDPHVALCASRTELRLGETVTLTALAVDIGLPFFQVQVRDEGGAGAATEFAPLGVITFDGQVRDVAAASQVVELAGASAQGSQALIELRALAPGRVEITVSATGEIHYGYPGPAMWGGGESEGVEVIVGS